MQKACLLPAGGTKQAVRGRGVGREKEAHSPPGSGRGGKNGGECHVHGGGTPRRKNETSLVTGGEWDAKKKLIPRLVQAVAGKTGGECHDHGGGTPRRKNEASMVAGGEWDAKNKPIPRPVQAVAGMTGGESGVHRRGIPRRKKQAGLFPAQTGSSRSQDSNYKNQSSGWTVWIR